MSSNVRVAVLGVALCGAACADVAAPGDMSAIVHWLEAAWAGETLSIRLRGTAGCDGLAGLAIERLESVATDETDLILRVQPRSQRSDCPAPQTFDTTVALGPPWTASTVNLWSPHPWEPGMLLYARTYTWSFDTAVGGELTLDTLPDGCWVFKTETFLEHSRAFAYDSISAFGFPKLRGMTAFVSGVFGRYLGCDSLPVVRLRSVHLGL